LIEKLWGSARKSKVSKNLPADKPRKVTLAPVGEPFLLDLKEDVIFLRVKKGL